MLQSRLIAKRPSFSSVDEHIAQIILSMPYDANLTSTSLASLCEVSQSTIVRFAQKLGYPSFREFLSDYVAYKLSQPTPLNASSQLKISSTQANIDYIDAHANSLHGAFHILCEAKRLYVVYDYESVHGAEIMASTFQDYGVDTQCIAFHELTKLKDGQVGDVVVFCETQHSTQLLESVLLSKHAQVHTLLITQKVNSPLSDYTQHIIHTMPSQRDPLHTRLEYVSGCLQILVHWIAYCEANAPALIEARLAFKARLKAISALAKHKALE
jgi:DNA-binding MurR/RpiR family transcriptional regulator